MPCLVNYELRLKRERLNDTTIPYNKRIFGPHDVSTLARALIGEATQEHFLVFFLDIRNKVLGYNTAAVGSPDSCAVDLRTVFRTALIVGAAGVILAHNHPSGEVAPSEQDYALTKRVKEAAALLDVRLLDHVIVSDSDSYSFAANSKL